MTRRSIQFGFCVPIFANPGMTFFRTPCYERLDWPTTRAAVLECEALGFDSLFVADHVFLGRDGAIYEGWTLLSVLAGMTQRIRLAPIHLCDSFRNPALTAKMVATLDVVSNGRFILFYDYGWRRAEFDAYGFAFEESDDARAAKMAEGLTIIKGMLTEPRFSFSGRYYRVHDAVCEPKLRAATHAADLDGRGEQSGDGARDRPARRRVQLDAGVGAGLQRQAARARGGVSRSRARFRRASAARWRRRS